MSDIVRTETWEHLGGEWTQQHPSWVTAARRVTVGITAYETVTLAVRIPTGDHVTGCGALSLNEYPCVKPPGHYGDHERFDGRTWPEGQTWGDVIGMFFRSQGIDPDAEQQ